MEAHVLITRHDGEGELLSVDVELVFSKLDDVGAIDKEFLAVLKLSDGVFFESFKLGLDVGGFDGVS